MYVIKNCRKLSAKMIAVFFHCVVRADAIEILYIEGTSGPWACPSSRQREKMSRADHLCPIAHAACTARQRRMVQFIGSLTLAPAGYHGRAHLQRRLYLVPSMYNISMADARGIRGNVNREQNKWHRAPVRLESGGISFPRKITPLRSHRGKVNRGDCSRFQKRNYLGRYTKYKYRWNFEIYNWLHLFCVIGGNRNKNLALKV